MGDSQRAAERIDSLIQQISALPLPKARGLAEDIVRELMQLYGGGLQRIVDIVSDSGRTELFDRFCDDPLVSSLMVLHGLHPVSLHDRVQKALDQVRPYLGSHGGNVRVVGVHDGVVTLRLEGTCDGCPSSTVTMKLAVEKAILDACPDVSSIEVEGQVEAAFPWDQPTHESVWHPLEVVLENGSLTTANVGGMELAVCSLADNYYAYVNRCPECQRRLGDASVRQAVLVCLCGQRFDIRRAGRSLMGGPALTALPLQTRDGAVQVATPLQPQPA